MKTPRRLRGTRRHVLDAMKHVSFTSTPTIGLTEYCDIAAPAVSPLPSDLLCPVLMVVRLGGYRQPARSLHVFYASFDCIWAWSLLLTALLLKARSDYTRLWSCLQE